MPIFLAARSPEHGAGHEPGRGRVVFTDKAGHRGFGDSAVEPRPLPLHAVRANHTEEDGMQTNKRETSETFSLCALLVILIATQIAAYYVMTPYAGI